MNDFGGMDCFQRSGNPLRDFQSLSNRQSVALVVGEEPVQCAVLRPFRNLKKLVVFVDVVELQNRQKIWVPADPRDGLGGTTHYRLALFDLLMATAWVDFPSADTVAPRVSF